MPDVTKIISPVNIDERKRLKFSSGDTIRVIQKIKEGDKTRLQTFEGLVIARKHGKEPGSTFTVRKISSGVGVERTFPLYSPVIEKIEVVSRSKTRRSKLYYVREKAVKAIRKKLRKTRIDEEKREQKAVSEPANESVSESLEAKEKAPPSLEASADTTVLADQSRLQQDEADKPEDKTKKKSLFKKLLRK